MAQVKASKIGLRALSYAEAFVGVKEQPSGTNHGPNVWRKINNRAKVKGGIDFWCERANGIAGGYPWCSAFATYCFEWAGRKIGDARRASVGFFEDWGRQHGYLVTRPFRGDLVCYRFDSDNWPDHIGIVQKVLALPGGGCYERLGNIDKNKIQAELRGERRPTAGALFARTVIRLVRLDQPTVPLPPLTELGRNVMFTAWDPAKALRCPSHWKVAVSADPAYDAAVGTRTHGRTRNAQTPSRAAPVSPTCSRCIPTKAPRGRTPPPRGTCRSVVKSSVSGGEPTPISSRTICRTHHRGCGRR